MGPRRDRDLDLAWIDCLLPGHPSTGFPLPTSVICSLRPITRHNTGEKSWVARYAGTEGLKVSPLDKSQRLHQKTRSQIFADGVEEHDAFRVTLLWLWRRHLCHAPEQASKQRLPEHVVRALAPRANGELLPCPDCMLGACGFMAQVSSWLLPFCHADKAPLEETMMKTPPPKLYVALLLD